MNARRKVTVVQDRILAIDRHKVILENTNTGEVDIRYRKSAQQVGAVNVSM